MTKRTGLTQWHVLTAARVFTLATALGLAAATGNVSHVAAAFLALCVLAGVMSIPAPGSALQSVSPIAEGALVALVLVSLGNDATPLMVYWLIPAFVAGLQTGGKWPLVAVASECLATIAAMLTTQEMDDLTRVLERTAPWMLVGLGLGLLGSWMHANGAGAGAGDQAGYEFAHRLLGQLRSVSRRLSSGLDTGALAEQTLTHTLNLVDGRRAMVLVRLDSGTLSRLAASGEAFDEHLENDSSVVECLRRGQPQRSLQKEGAPLAHRLVVPLRVANRMIGVVVADGPRPVDKRRLSTLRSYLDEQGLRLETALLFDEVRSTATMEERNRLAREIHDGIAQEVASLGYLVDDLAASSPSREGESAARELRRELSRVVSELRLSIFDLRSNVKPHSGLGLALSDYAREVGARSGLTVHLALSEKPHRLHVSVETELLRIAQEAITNARKHAKASNLWVTLDTESPIVMMRVEDDGVGSAEVRDDHYGLQIMQERAERVGGELVISPRPHGGTSVVVTVWPRTTSPSGAHRDDLSLAC